MEPVPPPTPASPTDLPPAPAAPPIEAGPDTPASPLAAETLPPTPPPGSSVPPVPPAVSEPEPQLFSFHGQAHEYFRIWIVNTLLTLLTCGVFAAWAKVRKRRYLRGNTELMGHRFDYRADPRRILIGNALVAVMFLAYGLFGAVYPWVRIGAIVIGIALLPWIVVRSLAFNAHNTVYRGMRFHFRRPLSGAVMVYLFQPLMIPLTLGLYYPAWQRACRSYAISNHRLGDARFDFAGRNGPFYAAYFVAGVFVVGAAIAGGVLVFLLSDRRGAPPTLTQLIPFFLVYGGALFAARHYIFATLFNHIWNHTRLDEHRFVAHLSVRRWLGLQLTNLGAIVISCGLLYPWTVIRTVRYSVSCLSFVPAGPIEKIERLDGQSGSAVGDATAEFVGLDFGL
jgi:uncharacterized membrane protein YjgN (DUF898 family)